MAGRLEVLAPWDRKPIGSVETVGADEIDVLLRRAEALFRDRAGWLPLHRRIEILERAAEWMSARAESLALESAREGGKPLRDSRVELARAVDGFRCCVATLRTEQGQVVPMGLTASSAHRVAFTRREPIGVVVAVSAFNHPTNLIVHQVGPAVAAGCPVIVKPAETTPLACRRVVDLLHEAGLPEEWCQVAVTDDCAVAQALATDPRVAFLSFIGSAGVGWMLRSKLAPGTRCALEHGGAAPVVVAADADLDAAVSLLTRGGFYHAGQVCVKSQRVFAERAVAETLAARLAESAKRLVVGDPTSEKTDVGPLILPREVDRVAEWVEEASRGGARVLCGGRKIGATAFEPTVLLDPPADARVSVQEIFGPVVCVTSVDSIDEAIARANSVPFAFQAAVLTRSLDVAMRVYAGLDASAVMVNDHTAFRTDWMPFAGLRLSGHGVGGIPHTIHEMQVEKMLVVHSPAL
jgi:acyl-CoA reductase-like NAD-dependent aldehyde dehydrogenase